MPAKVFPRLFAAMVPPLLSVAGQALPVRDTPQITAGSGCLVVAGVDDPKVRREQVHDAASGGLQDKFSGPKGLTLINSHPISSFHINATAACGRSAQ
ncbi:MAG TPA: hypothetical protein VIC54_01360 [Terriglobales bacterium]|jgi:hypothetical protein